MLPLLSCSRLQSVPFMMPKKQKGVVSAASPGEGSSGRGAQGAGAHREGSPAAGASSSPGSAAGAGSSGYVHYGAGHNLYGANRTGNIYEDYEGYIMDLLKILAEQLGFHYDLYLVPDNKFGVMNTTTQEWNGMVREIIEKVSLPLRLDLSVFFFSSSTHRTADNGRVLTKENLQFLGVRSSSGYLVSFERLLGDLLDGRGFLN